MLERLLLVAHGTSSAIGADTILDISRAVGAARPAVTVDLCFLDVADPRLADALDERPAVVIPMLLSTGYHVQTDIPAAVAAFSATRVARHLGPHPLLVDALLDRLAEVSGATSRPGHADDTGTLVLAAAGSSRPQAADEVAETARLLAARTGREVRTATMADDLSTVFAGWARPVTVATYLLAEGQFTRRLVEAAGPAGHVAAPIGAHPALIRLVWSRYDEACAGG